MTELENELNEQNKGLKGLIQDLQEEVQELKHDKDELNDTICDLRSENCEATSSLHRYSDIKDYIKDLVESVIYKIRPCDKTLYEVVDDLERIIR